MNLNDSLNVMFDKYTEATNAFTQSFGDLKGALQKLSETPDDILKVAKQNEGFFNNAVKQYEALKTAKEQTPLVLDKLENLMADMEAFQAEMEMLKTDNEDDGLVNELDKIIGQVKRNKKEIETITEKARNYQLNFDAFDIEAFTEKYGKVEKQAIEDLQKA